MNKEILQFVKSLKYKKMKVLEISGKEWGNFGFREYESLCYPEFDICKESNGKQYDLIIAEQVFEHIIDPDSAADNIYKMLSPGGILLVTTPFLIKYHPSPLDLWRWTKEGLKVLFERHKFTGVLSYSWGNKECVVVNLDDWPYYDKKLHSLDNDDDFPVVVWCYAFKDKK